MILSPTILQSEPAPFQINCKFLSKWGVVSKFYIFYLLIFECSTPTPPIYTHPQIPTLSPSYSPLFPHYLTPFPHSLSFLPIFFPKTSERRKKAFIFPAPAPSPSIISEGINMASSGNSLFSSASLPTNSKSTRRSISRHFILLRSRHGGQGSRLRGKGHSANDAGTPWHNAANGVPQPP